MNPKVDQYLIDGCGRCEYYTTPRCKVHHWKSELLVLRRILNECELVEELKWKMPCYTFEGKNVLLLSAFKDFCSISFFKGALLKDAENLLSAPGENSQAVRMFRFTKVKDILKAEAKIKAYVKEAIQIEKSGLKIDFKAKKELQYPDELQEKINTDFSFKKAFENLTPGRQRAYILFFSAPKQTQTRVTRIEKSFPKILEGKGPNER